MTSPEVEGGLASVTPDPALGPRPPALALPNGRLAGADVPSGKRWPPGGPAESFGQNTHSWHGIGKEDLPDSCLDSAFGEENPSNRAFSVTRHQTEKLTPRMGKLEMRASRDTSPSCGGRCCFARAHTCAVGLASSACASLLHGLCISLRDLDPTRATRGGSRQLSHTYVSRRARKLGGK